MKALQMTDSIPRYLLTKAGSRLKHDMYWGALSCLRYRDVEPPELPTPEWVRVRTRYGGICGTDIGTITLHASTTTTVFTSFPFTLGHENAGYIGEVGAEAGDFSAGERVVVNPLLSCASRGFEEPCSMCARGEVNLCQRFDKGDIAPGLMTGFCRHTGGSWSPEFVAHRSQVLRVPPELTDEEAVLTEPFAISLHAVLRNFPDDCDTVWVVGGGIIGLCTVAAIRALGSKARIIATVRHQFQADMARKLGADVVLGRTRGRALENRLVETFGAESLKPVLGKDVILGGPQYIFDCVGSPSTVNDSLRFAGSGGTVVIVGLAGSTDAVDWTPVWLNELTVRGDFAYAMEEHRGERISTMELALRLMAEKTVDLRPLVTHYFDLDDFVGALETVTGKGRSQAIKAVFAFDMAPTTSAPGG